MCAKVRCCVRNLQQFGYGSVLDELAVSHDVALERCLSQCVGCRMQPAAAVDDEWRGFDGAAAMKAYIAGRETPAP